MNFRIQTFFKIIKETKLLPFDLKNCKSFNYVLLDTKGIPYSGNSVFLSKQMNDSCVLEIARDERIPAIIPEIKLSNQNILTWEDLWISKENNTLIDPFVQRLNLQKNRLIHVNMNLHREELTHLNLEGNINMRAVMIFSAPKLEVLNVSNCPALDVINLGENRSIKALLAKNCNLSPQAQERLLRDFRPTKTASSNVEFRLFKKEYETIVDLRGSEIDWSNRKIASKIRLLLCNNWLVLWDNPPPVTIIPPHMYAFFTTNLEDSLIKDYYS